MFGWRIRRRDTRRRNLCDKDAGLASFIEIGIAFVITAVLATGALQGYKLVHKARLQKTAQIMRVYTAYVSSMPEGDVNEDWWKAWHAAADMATPQIEKSKFVKAPLSGGVFSIDEEKKTLFLGKVKDDKGTGALLDASDIAYLMQAIDADTGVVQGDKGDDGSYDNKKGSGILKISLQGTPV